MNSLQILQTKKKMTNKIKKLQQICLRKRGL